MQSPSEIVNHHDLTRRQVVFTMAGAMLALFLASLDQTIVATAMPQIITDLGGFAHYTWVTTAYMIASTITVLIVGSLTDKYGRKWFYIGGIAVFVLGSLLSGFSQTMTQIIMFRALQGIGAGIIMANTFTVIGDLFPPSERGKYQGFLTGVFGISSVIGPMAGGFITDNLSWNWVFFVNVPLGLIVIALFIFFFPQMQAAGKNAKIDFLGVVTMMLVVIPTMLALTWAGVEYAWGSFTIVGMFVFSAVMLVIFVLVERRASDPIIPLWIFSNRIVGISILVISLTGFGMFGGIIFIPLFFQAVLGASATASGSFLTPMMLGVVIGALISGQLLSRAGGHYRRHGFVALAIMSVGMFLLSRMSVETSYAQAVFNIIVMGFGLGISMPVYIIAVQNAVPQAVLGVATASTVFFRQIGAVFGLAILGSVMNNRFASEFLSNIPAAVKNIIPPERLNSLANNPQALLNPEASAQLKGIFEQLGPQGATMFEQMFKTLQTALNSAITQVFLVGLFVIILAWGFNLFIKEIPLKEKKH